MPEVVGSGKDLEDWSLWATEAVRRLGEGGSVKCACLMARLALAQWPPYGPSQPWREVELAEQFAQAEGSTDRLRELQPQASALLESSLGDVIFREFGDSAGSAAYCAFTALSLAESRCQRTAAESVREVLAECAAWACSAIGSVEEMARAARHSVLGGGPGSPHRSVGGVADINEP